MFLVLRRWDIKIAPQLPPGKKSSKNQLRRTASKMQGRKEEPEKVAHLHPVCSHAAYHVSFAFAGA